jgi:hypothetical protein
MELTYDITAVTSHRRTIHAIVLSTALRISLSLFSARRSICHSADVWILLVEVPPSLNPRRRKRNDTIILYFYILFFIPSQVVLSDRTP